MDKQQQTQPNPVYLAQLDWIEKHPKSKPLPVKGVEENNRELLVPMCSIPKGYENFQINSDGTFYLSLMHTWSMMLSEEESGRESTSSLHFHGIGKDVMKEIPGLLDDPEIIMASEPKQQTETQLPRIACVLDKERTVTNKETGKTEIETLVAFIEPPLNPRNKMSVIVSAYPMAEVEKFIEKADIRNEILYEKEKTLRRDRQGIPNAKAVTVPFSGSFDDLNIQRFKDNVNIKRMNFSGLYLRDIPEEERTLKVCNAALRQNPCAIEYFPEQNRTIQKYAEVFDSRNKDAIMLIPDEKFAEAFTLFVNTTKQSYKNDSNMLYRTINKRLSESQQAILKTMFSSDGKELAENEIIENIAKIIKERNSPSIQMDVRPMQNKTEENKMQKQNYYTKLRHFSGGGTEIHIDRENGTIDVEHNGEQPIMPGAEMNWNGFSLVDFERQDEDTRYHKYTAELNEQTAAFAEEIRKKALDNIGPEDYEATTEYAENETLSKAGWAWTRHQDGSGGFHNAKNPSPYNIYYDATTNEGWLKDAVRNETDFFYRTGYDDEGVEVFDLEKFKAAAEEKIASLLNINIEQENIMEKQNKQTPVQKAATNFVLDKLAQAGIEVITDKAEMREILNSGKLVQKMAAYHGTSHEGEIDNAFNGFGTYVVSVNNDVAKEQGKKIASKKYGDAFYIKSNGQEQTLEKFLSEHGYSQYWNELLKERNFDDVNKLQHEIMMRDIKGNAELEEQKTNLSVLLSAGVIEYKREKTYLYSIDIPDNNGSNYLSYESESGIEIAAAEKINAALEKIGTAWRVDRKQNGRDVYFNTLSEKVFNGNQEQASKFLKNVGFVGMTMNSANYIIFDEKDIVVNKRVQYMMDENGEVYGFTQDGKIYLDPDLMNSNTPVHEYTHIWDAYTQRTNPELWEKGKAVLQQTHLWQEVVNDPNYAEIADDEDLVLSEVHSRICGAMAEKVLERIATQDGEIAKDRAIDWDKETWDYIESELLPTNEQRAEFTRNGGSVLDLKEFLATPMQDFMNGRLIGKEMNVERVEVETDSPAVNYELDKLKDAGIPVSANEKDLKETLAWLNEVNIALEMLDEEPIPIQLAENEKSVPGTTKGGLRRTLPDNIIKLENRQDEVTEKLQELKNNCDKNQYDAKGFLTLLQKELFSNDDITKSGYFINNIDKDWYKFRLSDHRAIISDNQSEKTLEESVVIKFCDHNGRAKGKARLVEFTYLPENFTKEKQMEILQGIQDWIKTGEFTGQNYDGCFISNAEMLRRTAQNAQKMVEQPTTEIAEEKTQTRGGQTEKMVEQPNSEISEEKTQTNDFVDTLRESDKNIEETIKLNRPRRITTTPGHYIDLDYNENGKVYHQKESTGREIWRDFDENGKLTHYRDSHDVEKWYDENEREIHAVYPKEGYEEWHEYDDNGVETYYENSDGEKRGEKKQIPIQDMLRESDKAIEEATNGMGHDPTDGLPPEFEPPMDNAEMEMKGGTGKEEFEIAEPEGQVELIIPDSIRTAIYESEATEAVKTEYGDSYIMKSQEIYANEICSALEKFSQENSADWNIEAHDKTAIYHLMAVAEIGSASREESVEKIKEYFSTDIYASEKEQLGKMFGKIIETKTDNGYGFNFSTKQQKIEMSEKEQAVDEKAQKAAAMKETLEKMGIKDGKVPEFAMFTQSGLKAYKDMSISEWNPKDQTFTLSKYEDVIAVEKAVVTARTLKELMSQPRIEMAQTFNENTSIYEKMLAKQYTDFFEVRENTANNFRHNFAVNCRQTLSTPVDAIKTASELIKKMPVEERRKVKQLLNGLGEKGQSVNEKLVDMYKEALKDVPPNEHYLAQKRALETTRYVLPMFDTMTTNGQQVDKGFNLKIGDTINNVSFKVDKIFDTGKEKLLMDCKVVSATKEGNSVTLMDSAGGYHDVPRDNFLKQYAKQQKQEQKQDRHQKNIMRLDIER